jgi:Uncharacterized conserved protein
MKTALVPKKILLLFFIFLTGIGFPARLFAAKKTGSSAKMKIYKIDPALSEFTINTDTKGLFSHIGKNLIIAIKDFSGQVQFSEDSIESGSLKMKVMANSLTVLNKTKPKDKIKIEQNTQNKVLDSQNFPEISFESTQVSGKKNEFDFYEVKIAGNLTLHGVTRPIVINAQVYLKEGQLMAKGGLAVKQTDYKIKPLTLLGGAYTVEDQVDLVYQLVAHP